MSRSSRAVVEQLIWKRLRRTRWVATRSDEFLGMVELHAGSFVANDTVRGTYRSYDSLAEAKHALEYDAPFC